MDAPMYLFIMIWEGREFESVRSVITRETTYESGDPIMWEGKECVVLGTGLTHSEAKKNGSEYYNQVSALHGDGNWDFSTQTFDDEPGPSVEESDEDDAEPPTKQRRMK